jgi:hypothetical protein
MSTRTIFKTVAIRLMAIGSLFAVGGCSRTTGPDYELANVSGTITMDGAPLEGVDVIFEPMAAGSLSFGTTDDKGVYQLYHNVHVKGCGLGEHRVRLNKIGKPGTPDDTKNLLPPQYNENSQLTANVQAGDNMFNFDLKSTKPATKKKKGR